MTDKKAIGKLVLAGVGGLAVGVAITAGSAALMARKKGCVGYKWTVTKDKMFHTVSDAQLSFGAGALGKPTLGEIKTICSVMGAKAFSIDATGLIVNVYKEAPGDAGDNALSVIGIATKGSQIKTDA